MSINHDNNSSESKPEQKAPQAKATDETKAQAKKIDRNKLHEIQCQAKQDKKNIE